MVSGFHGLGLDPLGERGGGGDSWWDVHGFYCVGCLSGFTKIGNDIGGRGGVLRGCF